MAIFIAYHDEQIPPEVIGNFSLDWVETYTYQNYTKLDATVFLCNNRDAPFDWSLARALYNEKKHKDFWYLAKEHDLYHGMSVPIDRNHQYVCGMGYALDEKEEKAWLNKYEKEIAVLTQLFNSRYNQFCRMPEQIIRKNRLSKREIECAHWICNGNTLQQIADKMKITERTVRFHLNQLKNKLNARTKEQVIAKLVMHGLVKP
jgi:DNA-binding CsgD family transcriptional regulator